MSKLSDKLQRLLALATLKPGEDQDDSRVNEARTASYLLIRTVQENGVKLRFVMPAPSPRPAQPTYGPSQRTQEATDFETFFQTFFSHGQAQARAEAKARKDGFKRPKPPPGHSSVFTKQPVGAERPFSQTKGQTQTHFGDVEFSVNNMKVDYFQVDGVSYAHADSDGDDPGPPPMADPPADVVEDAGHMSEVVMSSIARCSECKRIINAHEPCWMLKRRNGVTHFHQACSRRAVGKVSPL